MAKSFYISFDKILQEEIKAHVLGNKSISLTKNQIKNPPIIKSKGRTSNKRTPSRFETTKLSNLSKKCTLEPNLQCTNEILEVDDIEDNMDFKSDNFQSSFKDCSIKENIQTQNSSCLFCADLLPNPLPEKIRLLLRKIANQNETRIFQMKDKLFDIINKKINSYYRDFALKICNEMGSRKASTPMALMACFEVLKPGYYGSRRLNIISDALSKLFLDTNLLTYDLVASKKPVDYLQEVLVPETALRLISQDRGGLELELAQEIMEDSADFGDYVHSE
ncbi:RTC4-like domain-containing protein [Gigaspora rosea]|uniref:Restriction of telomere capping protein 4 n=1 Tax=Gigaspora rosea TaxID=44941 RepID=A0A397ULH0_9GLOM|nr:RTC4-like domain-containing protein [Gigaspora rosea]